MGTATKNSFEGISETKFLSVIFLPVTFQALQTIFPPQRESFERPFANLGSPIETISEFFFK